MCCLLLTVVQEFADSVMIVLADSAAFRCGDWIADRSMLLGTPVPNQSSMGDHQ